MRRRRRVRRTRNGGWTEDMDLSWIPAFLFACLLFAPAFIACGIDQHYGCSDRHPTQPCGPAPVVLHIDPSTGQLGIGEFRLRRPEIMDTILRAKIMQSIDNLKQELERRRRAHLRVIP